MNLLGDGVWHAVSGHSLLPAELDPDDPGVIHHQQADGFTAYAPQRRQVGNAEMWLIKGCW